MDDVTFASIELVNALKYAVIGNKVQWERLEYYRRNIAEDSRYTFQIEVNLLGELGLILVKYRKYRFKCKRLSSQNFSAEVCEYAVRDRWWK